MACRVGSRSVSTNSLLKAGCAASAADAAEDDFGVAGQLDGAGDAPPVGER